MKTPSGKFIVRMDQSLHARLQTLSLERHVSINQLCVEQFKAITGAGSQVTQEWRYGLPLSQLKKLLSESGFLLQGAVIFGSAARGELTEKSDIDLLLVLAPKSELSRSLYTLWQRKVEPILKTLISREVSPQFVQLPLTVEDCGSLWFEVAIQGSVLWEENEGISHFLIRLREWIASGRVVRKLSHGHPYWVRASGG